ncbi:hypothetical protein HK097_003462 [Rhizophlyctis rosea]|uniref:Uncharacterized protein n=1 Tax=Rhizophlyctis rosea TaxID=64517 RepID=A0AAD5S449_9FUNG|nr:hypothetical protein HK097_003462 [Rhizophlyctis rosea]
MDPASANRAEPDALQQRLEEFQYNVASRYSERFKIMRTSKTFRTQAAHALIAYMIAGQLGRGDEQIVKSEGMEEDWKALAGPAQRGEGSLRHRRQSSEAYGGDGGRPEMKLESPYPTPGDSQNIIGASYPWQHRPHTLPPITDKRESKLEDRPTPYTPSQAPTPIDTRYPQSHQTHNLPSIQHALHAHTTSQRPELASPRFAATHERRRSWDGAPAIRPPITGAHSYSHPASVPPVSQSFYGPPPHGQQHGGPSTMQPPETHVVARREYVESVADSGMALSVTQLGHHRPAMPSALEGVRYAAPPATAAYGGVDKHPGVVVPFHPAGMAPNLSAGSFDSGK